MQTLKNLSRVGIFFLVASALYGCTLVPYSATTVEADTRLNTQKFNQLVSRDVASVLRQIDSLSPEATTLGLSRDTVQEDEFAAALDRELQGSGYAMRSIGGSPDTVPVSYSFSEVPASKRDSSDIFAKEVTVIIGKVAVRRSYAVDSDNNVRPLGGMSVRGDVDPDVLVNNDDIFNAIGSTPKDSIQRPQPQQRPQQRPQPQVAQVQNSQINQAQVIASQSNNGSAQNNAFNNNAAEANALALQLPKATPDLPGNSSNNAAGQGVNPNNIRNTLVSNFQSDFADTLIVKEKVLTFANDSTRMGVINKAQVETFIKGFNPGSDVVSIIGCSHGNTSAEGGQEALALGRAARVRDELLFSGIPEQNIRAEGCWAGEHFDGGMPRRGVVITLRRKVS